MSDEGEHFEMVPLGCRTSLNRLEYQKRAVPLDLMLKLRMGFNPVRKPHYAHVAMFTIAARTSSSETLSKIPGPLLYLYLAWQAGL